MADEDSRVPSRITRLFAEHDRYATVVLFFAALIPRLYVAIAWAREPVWDGHYYDFGARRIAAGAGYSDEIMGPNGLEWHPWCHYPVGYSGFLAFFYRLFGADPPVGTVVNAIVGALIVVLVHRIARWATTPTRARIAAGLAAISPGLILYSAVLMTELLAALGLLTATWLVLRARDDRPLRGLLVASVVIGLTTLVRPQTILCAPGLALLALPPGTLRSQLRRAAGYFASSLAIAVLVVLPWTVRNCRVMDGCAFVSTNAGWNLAIGASPNATGRFSSAGPYCGIVGQVEQDRCWRRRGLAWIREDPGRWLGLIPHKLRETFDHESFPVGYLAEANPGAWPEERKHQTRLVLSIFHRALLSVAALGVIGALWRPGALDRLRSRRGRPKLPWFDTLALATLLLIGLNALRELEPTWPVAVAIPLLAGIRLALPSARALEPSSGPRFGVTDFLAYAVLTLCLTHSIFFGEDRYHMVLTPALCVLAACALRMPPSRTPSSAEPGTAKAGSSR